MFVLYVMWYREECSVIRAIKWWIRNYSYIENADKGAIPSEGKR